MTQLLTTPAARQRPASAVAAQARNLVKVYGCGEAAVRALQARVSGSAMFSAAVMAVTRLKL